MSFQAYLDSVQAKTGRTVADFRALAEQKGLTKHGEMVQWLKQDFSLGHGHATAVAGALLKADHLKAPADEKVDKVFAGKKVAWRPTYDALLAQVQAFGPDVSIAPTDSYVSLLRGGKKFAIVKPGAERLDLGLKLKGTSPEGRFEAAGSWNGMVTHRVRVAALEELDAEVLVWFRRAYSAA